MNQPLGDALRRPFVFIPLALTAAVAIVAALFCTTAVERIPVEPRELAATLSAACPPQAGLPLLSAVAPAHWQLSILTPLQFFSPTATRNETVFDVQGLHAAVRASIEGLVARLPFVLPVEMEHAWIDADHTLPFASLAAASQWAVRVADTFLLPDGLKLPLLAAPTRLVELTMVLLPEGAVASGACAGDRPCVECRRWLTDHSVCVVAAPSVAAGALNARAAAASVLGSFLGLSRFAVPALRAAEDLRTAAHCHAAVRALEQLGEILDAHPRAPVPDVLRPLWQDLDAAVRRQDFPAAHATADALLSHPKGTPEQTFEPQQYAVMVMPPALVCAGSVLQCLVSVIKWRRHRKAALAARKIKLD